MDQQGQYFTFIATLEGGYMATAIQRMSALLYQVNSLHQCHEPGPRKCAYGGKPDTNTILTHEVMVNRSDRIHHNLVTKNNPQTTWLTHLWR